MSENNEPSAVLKNAKAWLTGLERATELRICFLVLSLVLAADVAAGLSANKNLFSLDWTLPGPDLHPGKLAVFLASYLLYMSVIAPLARLATQQFLQIINQPSVARFFPADTSGVPMPSMTQVRAHQLRDEALREQSAFLLKLVEDHEAGRRQRREELEALSLVLFACIGLFAADLVRSGSVVQQLAEGRWQLAAAAMAPFVWGWWKLQRISLVDDDWVHYPPLALKLAAQREEQSGAKYLPQHRRATNA